MDDDSNLQSGGSNLEPDTSDTSLQASNPAPDGSNPTPKDAKELPEDDRLVVYKTSQVAEMFQITRETVRSLIERGELGAIKVGGQWRIRRLDLIEYANKKYAPGTQLAEPPESV